MSAVSLERFRGEMIASLQRLGSSPTIEDYAAEEVRLAALAPKDADWEPLMQLRMKLIHGDAQS